MPPRHAKSTLVGVLWPAWAWASQPGLKWLFAAYAQSLTTRDSLRCRRLLESDWYRARWGSAFRLTTDQNTKLRFDNDRGGYRLSTSVGGSITGEGGDILVADDPHNVAEVHSQACREGVITWWAEVMSTRLHDPRTGRRVIVAHRVHERDLIGHLLAEGGWEHLNLPAEYEPGRRCITSLGWEDPRKEPGEALWPARFGVEELSQLKRSLGAYAAAAQLQQRPAPAEGGVFNPAWWRFYRPGDLPPRWDDTCISWDMSFGSATGSYTVGQVWARKGSTFYLLDQVRGRWEYAQARQKVRELSARWPKIVRVLVEDKANGPAILSDLRGDIPGLVAINPKGSKEARARSVSPLAEAGNVYLPEERSASWVGDLLAELASFPNSAYDDQVDALSQALERLRLGTQLSFAASFEAEPEFLRPRHLTAGTEWPIQRWSQYRR